MARDSGCRALGDRQHQDLWRVPCTGVQPSPLHYAVNNASHALTSHWNTTPGSKGGLLVQVGCQLRAGSMEVSECWLLM